METVYLIPLLLLGIAGSAQYYLGTKKNKWLGKQMSIQAERVLSPKETEYVNIGGVIGYNFVYKLRDAWKEAKGSFTFINLFTTKKLAGEGHIIEKGHLSRAKIDGVERMEREEIAYAGKTFILLWRNGDLKSALKRTLEALPEPATLSHFCCYDDNKTFFLYLKPVKGAIEANLKKFLELCPEYFR